jgi:Arc/MetJ-type ribon-helix-helix transcriptional regulator
VIAATSVIRAIIHPERIMDISLRPETCELIEERLKAGKFATADELVVAALEAFDELDTLDEATLDAIDEAEDQIERGEVHDWRQVREELRAKFLGK